MNTYSHDNDNKRKTKILPKHTLTLVLVLTLQISDLYLSIGEINHSMAHLETNVVVLPLDNNIEMAIEVE